MTYVTEYVVEGLTPIPFDMLRYDEAWPAHSGDAVLLSKYAKEPAGIRCSLKLRCVDRPEAKRWQSFGWTIVDQRRIS